VQGNK